MHLSLILSWPRAWLWFLLHAAFISSNPASHFSNETDRLALLHFKGQITDDPFHSLSSWNSTLPLCHWPGVTCSSSRRHHQRVTALNLTGYGLIGGLSHQITNLTLLNRLDLSNNLFHGPIPGEIGRLLFLQHLSLSNNTLSEEIPVNLTRCSELISLDLYGNNLIGSIPRDIGSLSKLTKLVLGRNNFTGRIPPSLGNLSALSHLHLSFNRLEGSMAAEFSQLINLERLEIVGNELSGTIPASIYNLSSIKHFDVTENRLQGSLPPALGLFVLRNLQFFSVANNQFSGLIPLSLPNATSLEVLLLNDNYFRASVPTDLGSLQHLEKLNLANNQLQSRTLHFFDSLTNCSELNLLNMDGNNLSGELPESVTNLLPKLQRLKLKGNKIFGGIPSNIGNLTGLTLLNLEYNMLTGTIPLSIKKLNKIAVVILSGNELSGEISTPFCNMTQLYVLMLHSNNLLGGIPSCLENCVWLQVLYLFDNKCGGILPKQLFSFSSLISLQLQKNFFSGRLPLEMGHLQALTKLDVSDNNLSGEIPSSLGGCLSLEYLQLDGNFFQGSLPASISSLRGLRYLDLERNHLSGNIPEDLGKLVLEHLNLSLNDLEGEVPKQGIFTNASAVSVFGNSKLCGGIQNLHLPACPAKTLSSQATKERKVIMIAVMLGSIGLSCSFLSLLWLKISRKKSSAPSSLKDPIMEVSYAELLKATEGFSSANLIGIGSCGSVYKGIMHQVGTPVAVKVFNLLQEGALQSFMAECETSRNIRHRNLVKILTCCSSIDFKGDKFKALVFEYMPNGNLRKWLHKDEDNFRRNLKLIERLNIAIDVGSAFDYLHHHCQPPIVHCDLKPSNVLLDANMVAHVSDFGLARPASVVVHSSSAGIQGTIGYIAPDRVTGRELSTEGDVYSYGILLLEMITGKKPTDEIFMESLTLHQFVRMAWPNRVMEIVDPTLLLAEVDSYQFKEGRMNFRNRMRDCLSSMARIGLACSADSPRERMEMSEVLAQMHAIRESYTRFNLVS